MSLPLFPALGRSLIGPMGTQGQSVGQERSGTGEFPSPVLQPGIYSTNAGPNAVSFSPFSMGGGMVGSPAPQQVHSINGFGNFGNLMGMTPMHAGMGTFLMPTPGMNVGMSSFMQPSPMFSPSMGRGFSSKNHAFPTLESRFGHRNDFGASPMPQMSPDPIIDIKTNVLPSPVFDKDGLVSGPSQKQESAESAADKENLIDEKSKEIVIVAAALSTNNSKKCNCKASKCLKLYCECLAHGLMCVDCNCADCHNNEAHAAERNEVVKSIAVKNPLAFRKKNYSAKGTQLGKSAAIGPVATAAPKRGCKCKKTMCLKKYCECFQSGTQCNELCVCTDCKNKCSAEPIVRTHGIYADALEPLKIIKNSPRHVNSPAENAAAHVLSMLSRSPSHSNSQQSLTLADSGQNRRRPPPMSARKIVPIPEELDPDLVPEHVSKKRKANETLEIAEDSKQEPEITLLTQLSHTFPVAIMYQATDAYQQMQKKLATHSRSNSGTSFIRGNNRSAKGDFGK